MSLNSILPSRLFLLFRNSVLISVQCWYCFCLLFQLLPLAFIGFYLGFHNPGDGGAWRAAVYGVTQSRTRLKWLSSSSSSIHSILPSHHWQAMLWLVTQSCPTVCDTMNCSPPGSSVYEDSPGDLMFSIENSRYSAISYMGNNLKRNEYM